MTSFPLDLSNCDREPIHIPGAIQPHGFLVACRVTDLAITHVSENIGNLLGAAPQQWIGQPIRRLFAPDEADDRERQLRTALIETKPVYIFTLKIRDVAQAFDAIAHRNGDYVFLELEPAPTDCDLSTPELYRLVQSATAQINAANSVATLLQTSADHVRAISGFDRVMVYQFDQEWNGQVVAESKRDDLEPFLGLHYPASDIPRQARELYAKNRLRFIADRSYLPSPIVPATGPTSADPLDLSYSVLRSVSPIHLEYLANMGVAASMSISLLRDGQLWGLIACHHYQPRFVRYDVRTACELLGQIMSLSLAAVEDHELAVYRQAMRAVSAQIVDRVKRSDNIHHVLIETQPNMLDFVAAEGAAIVMGQQLARIGQTPNEDQIRELSNYLSEHHPTDVFATDELGALFGTRILASVASGVLVISLGTTRPHQLFWFRTEQVRTVDWAGDPAKSVVKSGEEVRLSPRGSFALWKQTIRGRSKPWTSVEIELAHHLRDGLTRQLLLRTERLMVANTDLRLASEEREQLLEAERAARAESERVNRMKDEFVATLSHELRTPLSAILGWAQLLARCDGLTDEVVEGLDIIERNARSQAQMIEDLLDVSRIISGKLSLQLHPTNLPAILATAIQTVLLAADSKGVRLEKLIDPLQGIETTGDPNRLQQVFWNLLSNAVKFTPKGGKVQVVLEKVDSHVELSVTDTGQGIAPEFLPYVFDRFRQADATSSRSHGGLGLGLSIVRNLVELHGGTVRAFSAGAGQGASFVVTLPIRAVKRSVSSPTAPQSTAPLGNSDCVNLAGLSILALDDEQDARELVRRILTECDCQVTVATTINDALQAFQAAAFDVILSDIGMPGGDGFEFIKLVRDVEAAHGRPKTPCIALTAYARAEDRRRALLAGYQAHIAKPVERGELLAVIASLTSRV